MNLRTLSVSKSLYSDVNFLLPDLRSLLSGYVFRPPRNCGQRGVFLVDISVHTMIIIIHILTLRAWLKKTECASWLFVAS